MTMQRNQQANDGGKCNAQGRGPWVSGIVALAILVVTVGLQQSALAKKPSNLPLNALLGKNKDVPPGLLKILQEHVQANQAKHDKIQSNLVKAVKERPELHKNSKRYKINPRNWSIGRSGKTSLTARALIDETGEVELELTTGLLETPELAPGKIRMVQVRALDAHGKTRFIRVFNSTNAKGSQVLKLDGLARGQNLKIMALVSGVDGPKTEVLNIDETVKFRPDLSVVQMQNPERAEINVPVLISALVRELNGDAGATANCVLYVDGSEADRADGIWVDAGGAVSCAFSHSFTSDGIRDLRVEVTSVVPGDWDTANNSMTGTIEIGSSKLPAFYSALAVEATSTNQTRAFGWYDASTAGTSLVDWEQTETRVDRNQELFFDPFFYSSLDPGAHSMSFAQYNGNSLVQNVTYNNLEPDVITGSSISGQAKWHLYDAPSYTYIDVTTNWASGEGSTYVSLKRFGGEAVYFSRGFGERWPAMTPVGNTSTYAVNGAPLLNFGSKYTFRATFGSGGKVYEAEVELPMLKTNTIQERPLVCRDYPNGNKEARSCTQSTNIFDRIQGEASEY